MTTKDKLEFVHLMTRHTSATLADMQRLLRYANAFAAVAYFAPLAAKRARKIEAICDRFGGVVVFEGPRVIVSGIKVPV